MYYVVVDAKDPQSRSCYKCDLLSDWSVLHVVLGWQQISIAIVCGHLALIMFWCSGAGNKITPK